MALTWIMDNFNWTSGKNPCPIENFLLSTWFTITSAEFHAKPHPLSPESCSVHALITHLQQNYHWLLLSYKIWWKLIHLSSQLLQEYLIMQLRHQKLQKMRQILWNVVWKLSCHHQPVIRLILPILLKWKSWLACEALCMKKKVSFYPELMWDEKLWFFFHILR